MRPLALLLVALSSGCVVYESDQDHAPAPAPQPNRAPFVIDAEAGCYWDGYYHDDIWYFEAAVDDQDTVYDVVEVWADVYDVYHGDAYIESFELYPTNDPYVWFSDWLGSSTWLDCFYDGYVVDIVVYDAHDAYGVMTVDAYTY